MPTRLSVVPVLCLALLGLVPVACGETPAPGPTPPVAGPEAGPKVPPPSPTGDVLLRTDSESAPPPDPNRNPDVPPPSVPPTVATSEDPKDYPKFKVETLRAAADGAVLGAGMTAKLHYTGTTRNGREFDSSWRRGTEPTQFDLNGVVKGFRMGLLGMHVGERRRITMPGELAYGPAGSAGAGIGPNETLIFDVELVAIEPAAAAGPTGPTGPTGR